MPWIVPSNIFLACTWGIGDGWRRSGRLKGSGMRSVKSSPPLSRLRAGERVQSARKHEARGARRVRRARVYGFRGAGVPHRLGNSAEQHRHATMTTPREPCR